MAFWHSAEALLRRNLLAWLVEGPGTRTLPESPGEADWEHVRSLWATPADE